MALKPWGLRLDTGEVHYYSTQTQRIAKAIGYLDAGYSVAYLGVNIDAARLKRIKGIKTDERTAWLKDIPTDCYCRWLPIATGLGYHNSPWQLMKIHPDCPRHQA